MHIHEFQPLLEEKIEIRRIKPPEEIPQKLIQVLEVAELVFKGENLNEAFKNVAKRHSVHESTVRDKCARQLNIDTEQFREMIQNKNRLITFLKERHPQYEDLINEKLA